MTLAEFNDHLDQSEPPPLVDSEPDSSDTESEANDDEQEIIAIAPDDMHLPQEQPTAPVPGSPVVPVEESKGVGSLIIQISESDTRQ